MGNTIQASFGLNINPLRAAANQAQSIMKATGKRIGSFITSPMAGVGAAIGTFFTYETFKSGVQGVIEAGTQMVKLRAQTGMTVGSLAMLKSLALETDTDFDSLAGSVAKMQRNLFAAAKGGHPMMSTLSLLKLDIEDLAGMKPEEQFKAIGTAIGAMPNPMARAAASMAIFGRSGTQLLPLFEQIDSVDFGNLSEKAKLLEKDAETFHRVTIAFRKANANLKNLFVGIADQLAPVLLAVGTSFSKQSALGFGQTLGKAIGDAVKVFIGVWKNPGVLISAFINELKAGSADWMNSLAGFLIKCAVIFATGLGIAWDTLKPIGDLLAGSAMRMGGVLVEGVGNMITFLSSGLEFAFQKALQGFDAGIRPIVAFISAGLELAIEKLKEGIGKIPFLGAKAGLKGYKAKNFADILNEKKNAGGPAFKAQTFDEIFNRNKAHSGIVKAGKDMQATGDSMLDAAMKGFSGIGDALATFKENAATMFSAKIDTDFFGAAKYREKAKVALDQLKNIGESVLAPFTPQQMKKVDPWGGRFAGFSTFSAKSLLSTGGIQGAKGGLSDGGGLVNGGIRAANPQLLTHSERNAFMDAAVARGEKRPDGSVHFGDHKRQREFQRQQLLQKMGVDKSNEILEGILEQVSEFNG